MVRREREAGRRVRVAVVVVAAAAAAATVARLTVRESIVLKGLLSCVCVYVCVAVRECVSD